MKIKKIILFILVVQSFTLISQGDLLNMKKYWFYRNRLLNDFMVKGDCQGCSEALNERAFEGTLVAKWGDNTINLANYISVLATEFELLSQQSQPTDSTLEELYYAFRAFNRLDATAEASLPPHTRPKDEASTVGSNLNGFFMRDDIYTNFLSDHPELANGTTSSRVINSANSDFQETVNPRLNEMSHDQVWHLMMGFALVRKYIPPGTTWQGKPLNTLDFNADIWQEAENITGRIINRMKNDNWIIKSPNTGNEVFRGWYVQDLSYGAAEAACYVKNIDLSLDPGFPVHSCNDYHDFFTYASADGWMDAGHGYGILLAASSEEDFKVQILATLGNSWWNRANPFLPDPYLVWTVIHDPTSFLHPFTSVATLVSATVPVPPTNVTVPQLAARAILKDHQHLPLLRQVLHGGPNPIASSYYENLLDLGPCDGPHFFPGDMSTFEWSSSNRLHHPNHRGGLGNPGEYNGLDYMLYYNLFHIVTPNTVPTINYMDRFVTVPFPTMGTTVTGSAAFPAAIEAFSTITASNTLASTANVSYRAGKYVHLKPGFSANEGSGFHAYIDPFHCSSGDYRSMDEANSGDNQDQKKNSVAFINPTTSVKYPKRNRPLENNNSDLSSNSSAPEESVYGAILHSGESLGDHRSKMSILPNPTAGTFQISFDNEGTLGIKEIKIMDLMGNVVWSAGASLNRSFTADISSSSPGIYYVKSVNAANELEVKKLIKK